MKNSISLLYSSLIMLCILTSCTKDSNFIINDGLNPNNIIQITSIDPLSALADSSTQITVRVHINSNADSAENVVLTTTSGLINNKSVSETMKVNVNRSADFILRTGQTSGKVFIRAKVLSSYFRDTILTLSKAYPDVVSLNPDAYTISKGSSLHLALNLTRNIGYPSKDQAIQLQALDSAGKDIGGFNYTGSFIPGSPINANFTPPADYAGNVTLLATVLRSDGSKINGQVNIVIQ